MFEVFEKREKEKLNFDDELKALKSAYEKDKSLGKFLKMYIINRNRIITPINILKMMHYYKVEKYRNIDKIGEIGEFAASRSKMLKRKDQDWEKGGNRAVAYMKNLDYVFNIYKKLKENVTYKNQYEVLKNAFILMEPVDIKWFVRFLCRKVKVTKAMYEIVKKYNLEEMD